MNQSEQNKLAAALWAARESGDVVTSSSHPTTVEAAYALLNAVTEASERDIVGYKLGATTEAALELMGISEPFAGPLLNGYCFDSGHTAKVYPANNPAIETEFVLGLKKDLPTGQNLTDAEVADAVDWVAGGFEIIGARFAEMPTGRGMCTIADGAGNHLVVTGAAKKDWQDLDMAALPTSLSVNGETKSGISKDSVQGSPIGMLRWFANKGANKGVVPARGIKAGDIIYCGTCTGLTPIKAGDVIEADFGVLGKVSTQIN